MQFIQKKNKRVLAPVKYNTFFNNKKENNETEVKTNEIIITSKKEKKTTTPKINVDVEKNNLVNENIL